MCGTIGLTLQDWGLIFDKICKSNPYILIGHNEVTKFEMEGCTGDYCVIHKQKPLHYKATFVANQDTAKVALKLTGVLDGLEYPVPGI